MKMIDKIGVLTVLSALFICTGTNAVEYNCDEVSGSNGKEIIITVSPSQAAQKTEKSKDSLIEAPVQTKTNNTSKKDSVFAKYNLTPATNETKIKTQEETVVQVQKKIPEVSAQKAEEPIVKKEVQTTEKSYKKIEQPKPEKLEAKVEQNHKYYTNWSNAEAEKIVTKIGNNLKSASGLDIPLQFIVVNEEEVNACTDIDNNIYIFNGILPYLETEDELAFIIGHEMGHAASKHVVKSIVTNEVAGAANYAGKNVVKSKVTTAAASKLSGLGFGLGSVAGKAVVDAGDLAVDATTAATTNTMQRGRENDADLLAIDYLVKKGYNPLAGISIMAKIGDVYPDLFVDHPSTDKRVVTMYNYVKKNYPQYIAKGFNTDAYGEAVAKYVKKK